MTIHKLAKEIGVTPQAIYKKLSCEPLVSLVKKDVTGKWLITEEISGLIKSVFKQSNNKKVGHPIGNELDSSLKTSSDIGEKYLKSVEENLILKKKVDILEDKFFKLVEHSQEQSQEIINLAKQLAELTRNSQVLQGVEQSKASPKLLEERNKKSFWNIFRIKRSAGEE
jgi:uncharacterized coiled-coil DUF342 family protein